MALILLAIFSASCFQLSGCLTLHIEGNNTSFHFRLGEMSEIKFYVQNSGGDTGKKVIYVQHKALNTTTFDRKCRVSYWKKRCDSTNKICRCLGETVEGNAFSLNKIFLHSDSGFWIFQVWDHADSTVHVTVLVSDPASSSHWSSISTLSSSQSGTEESDVEQLSSNNAVSTAIITISLIIIVIAITSAIAIWQYPKFVGRNLQQFPKNKGFCFKTLHEREVDNEGEQLQSEERQSEQLLSHGRRWGAEQRCNAFGSKVSRPYKHYTFTKSFKKVANLDTRKSSDEADGTTISTTTTTATTATTDPTTTVTSTSTCTAATEDGDIYMNVSQQQLGSSPEHPPS